MSDVSQNRKIIHIDMDCFYAAVEMRDNPAYKDIPLAIGVTANIAAKLSSEFQNAFEDHLFC